MRDLIAHSPHHVLVVDKLTYAGTMTSLRDVSGSSRFAFVQADICNTVALSKAIEAFQPDVITHLAAESHVDRSIDGPGAFVQTNLVGTYSILAATLAYWRQLDGASQRRFRFHHISTDEVFGSLGDTGISRKPPPMIRARPIRRPRPDRIIWCGPGTIPMACRCW